METHGEISAREERLSRYLDGQLSPGETVVFETELERDEGLRDELRQWQTMRNRLRIAVQSAPVPQSLEADILAKVSRPGFSIGPIWGLWRPLAALAMSAFLVVAIWLSMRERVLTLADFPPAVAAMMEIGIGKHVGCVKERIGASFLPLGKFQSEVPPEFKEMLEAAQRALPADFKLVELHICTSEGRDFAHLTLTRGNQYLSVLLTERRPDDPVPTDGSMAVAQVENMAIYAVDREGLSLGVFALPRQYAFIVSDLGRDQNVEYTRRVAEAVD